MTDKIKPTNKKQPDLKKKVKKIIGLDIDKAEYQEIILSQSNFPDRR
ncbi:MAG: hypothetical protein PHV68_03185 [Candidatus Gastranaerophilales bacterium]|nr:hypothetical protein [Candidatus Gastranaerophilales bacterium]